MGSIISILGEVICISQQLLTLHGLSTDDISLDLMTHFSVCCRQSLDTLGLATPTWSSYTNLQSKDPVLSESTVSVVSTLKYTYHLMCCNKLR